ncbi:serine carboxypeptidase-like 50 [Magnolia sinica]|uniref:serine carboxypeptidase-like 50 n=1 Tax=Magnolia sinica TaxID=86752 RepID=UPI002657B761|nr:serine carboxypeptidase-like 50 [Magnolia sinica]
MMGSTPSNSLTLLLSLASLPLFLATSLAAATPLPGKALPTKSRFLPINVTSGSAMFFAFYESPKPHSPPSQTPLLIWHQSGPGCSSMIGNYFELGPWLVSSDDNNSKNPIIKSNPGSWNHQFGLVFIDNPIGSGFSIAATQQEIPKDQKSVAQHLFIALQTFLSLEPSCISSPLYIIGESYGEKYATDTRYYILQQNSRLPESQQMNLQGVGIGNSLTEPAPRDQLEEIQDETVRLTREGRWREVKISRDQVFDWLQNATGLAMLYDPRRKRPYETDRLEAFPQKEEVKVALGVEKGMIWELCSGVVGDVLIEDVMKSVKFMVEFLKKIRVFLYHGQLDLTEGVVSNEAWMKDREWEGLQRFLKADRKVWEVNGEVNGYVQRLGSLTHVVVLGANHFVPADQGLSSQAMIEDWILEKGLFANRKR